jgi:DNA-binding transcriptional MerR regulator
MGQLVTIRELAEQVGIRESKIRRWTKKGILTPIRKSSEDGKSFLYNLDCVQIKLEILDRIRIDFSSLDVIGEEFQQTFGRRDCDLLEALQTAPSKKELIRKYVESIRSGEND